MKRVRSNFTIFFPFFEIILQRKTITENELFVIDHLSNQVINNLNEKVIMVGEIYTVLVDHLNNDVVVFSGENVIAEQK